jgi:hypothetical protein
MTLPALVRKSAEKLLARFCAERIPPCAREQLRLGFAIHDDQITLFEERPAPSDPSARAATPIARFRYSHDLGQWTLHYPDRQRRWRFYLNAGPSLDLRKLLRHLDADPLHLFWE